MSSEETLKFLLENRTTVIFILNHYKKRLKAISETPSIQSRFVGIFREEILENLIPQVDLLSNLLESDSDNSKYLQDHFSLLKSAVGCYISDFELTQVHLSKELIIPPPYSDRIKKRHELIQLLDQLIQES